ncbi:MAG: PfkB family carbohydrate kinase, partial [Rhodococcus sp. (in: high G+C Gram-positive bacteria)]
FADELLGSLSDAGVDVALTRRSVGPSGIAAITVDTRGENSIVVVPGANSAVVDLTEAELQTIADADVLLCQLEIPMAAVVAGATHARANGTLVVLNPSPVQTLPDALVEVVDIVIVNDAEASALGADVLGRVDHVVRTLGSSGATYTGPGLSFDAPAPTVDAVDTTGAGDAFAGALVEQWFAGPERAIRWACAAGAFAATRRGGGTSSGTRLDIEALLGHSSA